MSVDVPGRLRTIEMATLTRQVVAIRCRPSWIGLVTWRCHVVVVVGVVERLREVVETKRRQSMMVVEKERVCLFMMCM